MAKVTKSAKAEAEQESSQVQVKTESGVQQNSKKSKEDFLREMLKAGVHFGHHTSRWHPSAASFIFTDRGGIHIIDLEKTVIALESAKEFLNNAKKENKSILFVGTKKQIRNVCEEAAKNAGVFYMTERWMGGLLTNFSTIKKRLKRMKTLKDQFETGEINKYVKKERIVLANELEKLEKDFGGIKDMVNLPEILVVVDAKTEHIALREAKMLGIKVIAIVDTNNETTGIQFPIPGNDDAPKSVEFLLSELFSNVKIEKKTEKEIVEEDSKIKEKPENETEDEGLEVLEEKIEEETDKEELEEKKTKRAKSENQ